MTIRNGCERDLPSSPISGSSTDASPASLADDVGRSNDMVGKCAASLNSQTPSDFDISPQEQQGRNRPALNARERTFVAALARWSARNDAQATGTNPQTHQDDVYYRTEQPSSRRGQMTGLIIDLKPIDREI